MEQCFQISLNDWIKYLKVCVENYLTYAPITTNGTLDYEVLQKEAVENIIYNSPQPISPLKLFFLPVKKNVGKEDKADKSNLIIGVPSCDLIALDMLDEMYLNEPFVDTYYHKARENSILIGTDCFSIRKHCHCNSYNQKPYPIKNFDISLKLVDNTVLLCSGSDKGETFLNEMNQSIPLSEASDSILLKVSLLHKEVENQLDIQNNSVPDFEHTKRIVMESNDSVWEKYSKKCVSCGACASICPTCTCFLLVDRPDFDKVRVIDACQYPGFARIAAGEDQLRKRYIRFRNRYLCKYVWKPEKLEATACTGCGRCIDACIGKINKNELFIEQASLVES